MIHSVKFTVVLDACVLYPAPIRDLLLSFAAEGLFTPKWSDLIQEEWTRNLLANRLDLSKAVLDQSINAMNSAFLDSNVSSFEDLIPSFHLPDLNDRHVLACAVRSKADLITTFNLKDFPNTELMKYDIEVQHPDEFVLNLIQLNKQIACKAFNKMVNRLKKPPKTSNQVIEILTNSGLKLSADALKTC